MDLDRTPAVSRALEAARLWAARLNAASIAPVHLLLGLLDEEEGRAAVLLGEAGVTPHDARQELGRGASETGVAAESLAWHSESRQSWTRARELAVEASEDRAIASDTLLLGLLRQDEALRRNLESLGLDFGRLEQTIAGPPRPPVPLDEPLDLSVPAEQMDVARILDANANRAREALRVLEEHCRFVLDDAFLSGELKRLRHDLTGVLVELGPPGEWGLAARDTLGDVGTGLSTAAEEVRLSPLGVLQANCKRLQEALRCLEEFGKLKNPDLGRAVEELRYRSYTLEKALVLGGTARQRLAEARLYVLLTGAQCQHSLEWTIREAAAGGAEVLQLREKELTDRELLERARAVRRWTREARQLFILNDRSDLARLADADGVHLGQDDLPVREARRILGAEALIGVSTHNLEQLRQAIREGASYVGIGPTFPSGTKQFEELAGLEYVKQALAETSLPAFVIGGVNTQTIGAAVAAGARRVAVSQAIAGSDHPREVAAELRRWLDRT